MYAHRVRVVTEEARTGLQILWSHSYRKLWATTWVLETELMLFCMSALKHLAISSTLWCGVLTSGMELTHDVQRK